MAVATRKAKTTPDDAIRDLLRKRANRGLAVTKEQLAALRKSIDAEVAR